MSYRYIVPVISAAFIISCSQAPVMEQPREAVSANSGATVAPALVESETPPALDVKIFDLKDLRDSELPVPKNCLADHIRQTIDVDSWSELGAEAYCSENLLVARNKNAVLDKVAAYIGDLWTNQTSKDSSEDEVQRAQMERMNELVAQRSGAGAIGDVALDVQVAGEGEPLPGEDPLLDPESERALAEARSDMVVQDIAAATLADNLVRIGVNFYQKKDYLEATRHFRMALEVDPSHQGARTWLNNISRLMDTSYDDPTMTFINDRDRAFAEHQMLQARIVQSLREGKTYFERQDYDRAIAKFEETLERIRFLPMVIPTDHYEREAQSLIIQAKEARIRQHAEELERQREIAVQLEIQRERRELVARSERIRELARTAQIHFDRGNYLEAEQVLDTVLYLDPYNDAARTLQEITRRARHESRERNIREDFRYYWQVAMTEAVVRAVPQSDFVDFPEHARWEMIRERANRVLEREQRQVERDVAEIEAALESQYIKVPFQDTPFENAIDYLRTGSGLNILVTPEALRQAESSTISLGLNDELQLKNALNLTLTYVDLDYYISNGAIVVATPEEVVKDSSELRTYDVRDLLAPLTDFAGVDITLSPASGGAGGGGFGGAGGFGGGFGGAAGGGDEQGFNEDNLIELIQDNVHADTWGDSENTTLEFRNGTLIARNRPEVLDDVERLLTQLRSSAGLVVNIETRFVTVEDNFLEDIGVDMRNLGNQLATTVGLPGKGTQTVIDDSDFGSNASPSGIGTNAHAGVFFNDKSDGDIRARSENLFDSAVGDPTVLSNRGGFSMQFTYIDDTQLEAILRAVRKNERVNLVTAPSLAVFNTQRANVTIVNQVSYISDFEVEVAQAAFMADPVISTVQDGIVLDVRPIISADRRFITLELRPTVAELVRPIPTITTALGAGNSVRIETPEIKMRKLQSTITIPDGGTIVIGGLRQTREENARSGLPWLSDIPIVRFFVSRYAQATVRKSLVVIVKANIIIMSELEEMNYGS
ncbi:MAG: hypothetical protein NUW37_05485 [Planctomycetes bacterium]|nr:hypothetical protein [Planctomycetota bacterium]